MSSRAVTSFSGKFQISKFKLTADADVALYSLLIDDVFFYRSTTVGIGRINHAGTSMSGKIVTVEYSHRW